MCSTVAKKSLKIGKCLRTTCITLSFQEDAFSSSLENALRATKLSNHETRTQFRNCVEIRALTSQYIHPLTYRKQRGTGSDNCSQICAMCPDGWLCVGQQSPLFPRRVTTPAGCCGVSSIQLVQHNPPPPQVVAT